MEHEKNIEQEKAIEHDEKETIQMEKQEKNESLETNETQEPIFAEEETFSAPSDQETEASSGEVIAKLTEQIKTLEQELLEKENRILRLQADFDNYRRRTRSEMEAIEKYRSQSLALEILPSVDNFERALQVEAKSEEGKSILSGMEMIYKGLLEALKKEGVEPIETVGKEFDPKYHHAVMQGNDETKDSNIILEEYQKGYLLKDRVLRPAMVKVNQ